MTATASCGNGTPPISYTWHPGGMTTPTVSNLCSGNYTIIAKDSSGNYGESLLIIPPPSVACVGIKEIEQKKGINFYPNPTSGILHFKSETSKNLIEIFNSLGEIVFSTLYSETIDISSIPKGIYFLTIQNTTGRNVFKLLKE